MSAEELKWTVLAMADADDAISEDVKLLILGALDSDEMFAEVLRGDAGPIVRPDPAHQSPATVVTTQPLARPPITTRSPEP